MQAVVESGVVEQAKTIGDDAPNFTLPDAAGDEVRLADLLAEGPVVLVWYRGGWCPYCSVTLRAYHEALPRIEAAGGKLVAISPELPDHTAETVDENELDFIVLSDVGNRVAADYGVVFELTPEVHSRYNEAFGFDAHNGQDSGTLPLAATYVIDEDGVIRYAFLDADYSKRAEPSEVIAALEGLSG
jgi:peroxiredoxin